MTLLWSAMLSAQGAWIHTEAPGEAPATQPFDELLAFHTGLGQPVLAQVPAIGSLVLYAWDGTTWGSIPSAAYAFYHPSGMAYDPVRQQLVVVSAASGAGPGQVSEWSPNAGLVSRGSHSVPVQDLCWYPPTSRVVAWVQSGIWQWDGAAWTVIPGTSLPTPYALDLAFDPVRSVLVGSTRDYGLNGQTFEWDGASVRSIAQAPPYLRLTYAPEFGGVIGMRRDVNATYRWDPAPGVWHAVTGSFDYAGIASGYVHLVLDETQPRTVARRTGNTGIYTFDPAAPPHYETLLVDPATPGSFASVQEAIDSAGPNDRVLVLGLVPYWRVDIYKPVRLECAPGVVMPTWATVELAPGEHASITGGIWGTIRVDSLSLDVTFRGMECRNILLTQGGLRLEKCIVTGGTHALTPDTSWAITGLANTTLTVDACTVTGTAGYWWLFPNPFWVPQTPAVQAASATIVGGTLTGGNGAAAASFSASGLIVGGTVLTTTGAPALAGSAQITNDVVWNGTHLPGALPAISYLDAPATSPLGATLTIDTVVQPGDVLFVVYAQPSAPVAVAGSLLPLQVDPLSAIGVGIELAPGGGVPIAVPNVAGLAGLETWWQGAALTPSAGVQLTNLRSVTLH